MPQDPKKKPEVKDKTKQVEVIPFWEMKVNPFEELTKFLGFSFEGKAELVEEKPTEEDPDNEPAPKPKNANGTRGNVVVNVNGVFRKLKPKPGSERPDGNAAPKKKGKTPGSEESSEGDGGDT